MSKKIPFYFTIDFEDFYFNNLRSLGHSSPTFQEKGLFRSYKKIKEIKKKYLQDKPITFFVTAIIANKYPDLIKEIFNDKNEIACHYNFHDKVYKQDIFNFSKNLDVSIKDIEKATGERPKGFRAPNFSLNENNIIAFKELNKRFEYDSSLVTSKSKEHFKKNKFLVNENLKIKEFFVYEMPIFNNFIRIKSGGTYLRVFSEKLIKNCMKQAYEFGHIPICYLHPYELDNQSFWIKWKDLNFLNYQKKFFWWARQYQWLKLGHKNLENKVENIIREFDHLGAIQDNNIFSK